MKFKADRATLMKALAHIQSVAEKRNTIPILANALIEVERRQAQPSPRPTWRSPSSRRCRPSVARDGATTAPAATLYEIVRKLPDGAEVELDLNTEDAQLPLRAGQLRHQPGDAAGRRLPEHDGRAVAAPASSLAGADAARPDRPHPLRDQRPRRRATT